MKAGLLFAGIISCMAATAQQPVNKKVTVYTTADQTDYRLSKVGSFTFEPLDQPLETQPCVFIDATKAFQTITGIGGAITDASAETFAKLSKDKQRELLTAYYDVWRIGYSLARTNINSTDFSRIRTPIKDGDIS